MLLFLLSLPNRAPKKCPGTGLYKKMCVCLKVHWAAIICLQSTSRIIENLQSRGSLLKGLVIQNILSEHFVQLDSVLMIKFIKRHFFFFF